ncbi:MAG: hypothetical protein COB22_00280 [Cycloclasticus sp.]|nr:MAG: hypothetical protein COB22_00280 [Cycloclasticus sp.]
MLVRVFLLFFIAVTAVGCAHVKHDGVKKSVVEIKDSTIVQNEEKKSQEQSEPLELDAQLLYTLLGGELAGQRGEIGLASAFYGLAAEHSKNSEIALRAAQVALYSKDLVAAKTAVDILVQNNNLSAQTRRLVLTVYLRLGDTKKSLEQIRMLLNDSDIPIRNALLAVGDMVSRHASEDVATEVMAELVKEFTSNAAIYLARSQMMMNFDEMERAFEDAEKATQLDKEWQTGYVQLARVLEKQGKRERALNVLKQAAEQNEARQLLMGYGQLLAQDGQYQEAKQQFLKMLSKEPNYPDARFAIGLVYLKLDDVLHAKESFARLYEDKAFQAKAAFYLGRIHYQQKEYEDAITWFKKVEDGAGYIDAQASMAMIYMQTGDTASSRSVLQTLRNRFPKESTRFYLLEAELLTEAEQFAVLYELMTEAVKEDADNLMLRYARSIAATEVGELAMAEQDLLLILSKEPKNVNALNALGYTLASKTFRFKEARQYLTQAITLKPNDSAIMDSMGWLSYREGRYEEALVLLEKAYKKMPEGEIAAHLGETLWMLGRQKEARTLWEEALKKDTENRYLIEVLKRLQ